MKFRTKLILCNVILVSIAFTVSGYLLLNSNYESLIGREINASLEENELLLSTVETSISNMILKDEYIDVDSLERIRLLDSYKNLHSEIAITNEKAEVINGTLHNIEIAKQLIRQSGQGKKSYVTYEDSGKAYIMVASSLILNFKEVYIFNQKNITSIYTEIRNQERYYRIMVVIASLLVCMIMFGISYILTNSIKKLHISAKKIADGDYKARTNITSKDEIGELSTSFDKMAQSVEEQFELLVDEGRKRNDFVANFTHELKTPLTTVIGYADMLRMPEIDEETRKMAAEYIFNEGMRLETMSMKLFELFLLGEEHIKLQPICIQPLLEEVRISVEPKLKNQKLSLHIDCPPIKINGEYELIKTVLINLIDNARKASEDGKLIEIKGIVIRDKIRIVICDHGHGIAPEEVDKITEAFYMVDKSRTRKEGGAGLGLALVSKIVNLHKGTMKIQSRLNKGTRCILEFDLAEGMSIEEKGMEEAYEEA